MYASFLGSNSCYILKLGIPYTLLVYSSNRLDESVIVGLKEDASRIDGRFNSLSSEDSCLMDVFGDKVNSGFMFLAILGKTFIFWALGDKIICR